MKHHEESHVVGFPIKKGLTYRRRKGHEYCAVVITVYGKHDMCEYIAANTTEEVFSRDVTFAQFTKEFEPTQLGLNEVLTMLKNRAARAGATDRAQYLLEFLIAQIDEGEVEMATKKSTKPAAKKAAPEAKAAPAKSTKKSTPAPVEKAGPGRKSAFNDSMKITVLSKENPKRAKAAERFALYKNGMTIGDYVAAGGTLADVRWDVKQSFISVK